MSYESTTQGIRVQVQPTFSLSDSNPAESEFVFSYRVNMENRSEQDARLLFRHWHIHDAVGEDTEVDGEGVIGQQPRITVGGSHDYMSYCVLRSPVGWMEGHYTFERPDGSRFEVAIPRFDLRAPFPPPGILASGPDGLVH